MRKGLCEKRCLSIKSDPIFDNKNKRSYQTVFRGINLFSLLFVGDKKASIFLSINFKFTIKNLL